MRERIFPEKLKLALVMVGLLRQWELELPVHFIPNNNIIMVS